MDMRVKFAKESIIDKIDIDDDNDDVYLQYDDKREWNVSRCKSIFYREWDTRLLCETSTAFSGAFIIKNNLDYLLRRFSDSNARVHNQNNLVNTACKFSTKCAALDWCMHNWIPNTVTPIEYSENKDISQIFILNYQ